MSTSTTDEQSSGRDGIPRWIYLTLGLAAWLVGMPLVHGLLPWALTSLTPLYGWRENTPGTWNLLGLIPVMAAIAGLTWTFLTGLARTSELPERMERLTPPFLMTNGPYAFTRNPMYVAELTLWLGWALLYGSVAVLLGFTVLGIGLSIVVPLEEHFLEAHFGEACRQYQARVPRWL